MKNLFKVFALKEERFLTGAILGSDGITEYDEMIVVRFHNGDFDTEIEAIDFMAEQLQPEHGWELLKVFVQK